MKYAQSGIGVLAASAWFLVGCPDENSDDTTTTDTGTTQDSGTDTGTTEPPALAARVLATGLEDPFEIALGPEPDTLWVTERTGKRISSVSITDGAVEELLTIDEVLVTEGTQDGLLGMAMAGDAVFVAYTYAGDGGERQTKIVRLLWDAEARTLTPGATVIDGLPGSTDHNAGRLRVGPDDKLYYTIGDQGHNQLALFCEVNHAQDVPTAEQVAAQDWSLYQGKTLRLNPDGSIPEDNPEFDGVQSHLYTIGHRNPQGLAFTADGEAWSVEQGPKTDDELNHLLEGRNYGWPYVAGFQDDQAYVWADWSASVDPPCADLEYSDFEIPPSVPVQEESAWDAPANFEEPAATFGTVEDGFDFQDPDCADSGLFFLCWPTIAPSSVEAYGQGEIADGELLITSLKSGNLYAMAPTDEEPRLLFHGVDRFRDSAVSEDGGRIWVATDSAGFALGDDGIPTETLTNPGAILELTADDGTASPGGPEEEQ